LQGQVYYTLLWGDWNATPEELDSTGWCKKTAGRVVESELDYTCTASPRREIDFFITHDRLLPLCGEIFLDEEAPTRPHSTIGMDIKAKPREVKIRVLLEPRPLPMGEAPKEPQEQAEDWGHNWAEAKRILRQAKKERPWPSQLQQHFGWGCAASDHQEVTELYARWVS